MAESTSPGPGLPRVAPWLRLGPVLVAAAVYLVFMARPELWNRVIWPHAMAHYGLPFVDMQGHLASSRAFADGRLVPGAEQLGWWLMMTGLGALLLRLFAASGLALLGRTRR